LPQIPASDKGEAEKFEGVIELVSFIRQIKTVANVKQVKIFKRGTDIEEPGLSQTIEKLSRTKVQEGIKESLSPGVKFSTKNYDSWLDIAESELAKAIDKLEIDSQKTEGLISRLQSRLDNKEYMSKAPEELKKQTKMQLEEEVKALEQIKLEIKSLKG